MAPADPALARLRAQAQARADALGAPSSRLEAWRYVDVRALEARLDQAMEAAQALVRLDGLPGAGARPAALIIDGAPVVERRQLAADAPALTRLGELDAERRTALLARWEAALGGEDDVGACWSLADGGDGLHLEAASGVRRLELWLVATGGRSGARLAISVGPGASLDLVLRHIDLGAARSSVGIDATVSADGCLHVDEVQASAHPGGTAVQLGSARLELGARARASWVIGQQGGALVRHCLHARLAAAHSEFRLGGLAVLDGSRQAHLLTRVVHEHGPTSSIQHVRTVCDGRAAASFDGLVKIRAGADGADARQYHHSLLMAQTARVDTRPQLDIAADDVQAAHGASVGRPNPDELFYLRSRGLSAKQALALLRRGFAADVVLMLRNPGLRALADALLLGSMDGRWGRPRPVHLPRAETAMAIDPTQLRAEFPGLEGTANGKPFVYLDSAASAQKHRSVIERMDRFLRSEYGTVHRGLYARSVVSTQLYEQARISIARFLNAGSEREVVFTMGCTDAINLVAWSWGRANLKPGDRVLVTGMEHHAGIVPWQITSQITGAELVAAPLLDDGSLDLAAFDRLLDERVKLVGCTHIANALGTINPVKELCAKAHRVGARFLIDAAQSAPHLPLDVRDLDCDFLAFAGHKLYGPTGIGVLYAKGDVLESMPPWRGGGEMIDKVSFARTTYAPPPARFEAGTPPFVEAIGLATACDWLRGLGMAAVHEAERALFAYAEARLAEIPGLTRIGTAPARSTVLAFTMQAAHPADIANILDLEGVAIRAGHHCAQPVMERFGVTATARASLGIYSTRADIDQLVAGLRTVARLFG